MYNHVMKRPSLLLFGAALAILAGCSATAVKESTADQLPADGIDFRFTAKDGDKYGYKLSVSMESKGAPGPEGATDMDIKIDMAQEVAVTKEEDGNLTLNITNKDVEVSGPFAAEDKKSLMAEPSKVTIDDKGRVISQEGSIDAGGGAGGTIYFPDKKVKVGDTWEKTTPGPGGQSIKALYKFEQVQVLDGVSVARISMTPEATAEEMKFEGRYDYWVDLKTAMVVKADGKVTMSSQGQSMVTTMAMSKA
jgi:hypothetical protein